MQAKHFWAVVPAAGVGRRMGSDTPKQYLRIGEKRVIEHTLQRLFNCSFVCGVIVVIGESDDYWDDMEFDKKGKECHRVTGGVERCDSVVNALEYLLNGTVMPPVQADDFVLVHDAVRPCIRESDIHSLINKCSHQGAILAVPVRDTLKLQDSNGTISQSVEREGLWQAQTPQMFPLGELYKSLQNSAKEGIVVTDESTAMEMNGYSPILVHGSEDNIKITRPQDLILAGLYLESQQHAAEQHVASRQARNE